MEWYHYLLIGIGALLILLISVLLIRTACFKPKKEKTLDIEKIEFDKDGAVSCLQELIRCKTISYDDPRLEDDAEFEKLINLLPTLYPNVLQNCELKRFDGRALLFRWKGKSDADPVVLMSHYDVVSVVEENWSKPPFDGVIENGELWGRGVVDTKATFNAVMYSINMLIGQGFIPQNDVYMAFSGGEEVNGPGAKNIVEYFRQNGVSPQLVLDEGGAVVNNVFPGVNKPCGMIGIAEKGCINLKYTVKSSGGHASAPKPNTPLVRLAKACDKMEKNPFRFKLTEPVAKLFDKLGRESTFLYRLIFSNLWLFKGLLNKICIKNGGDMNAMCRTTVAFTQAEGSKGMNVIPPVASMVSNIRLNPCDTVDSAVEYIKKTIDDDNVQLEIISAYNPSRISRTDVPGYAKIESAVKCTWENVLVSPYLMVQCSDSRHYGEISDRVYKFSAMDLTNAERSGIHGNDEKVRISAIYKSIEFYLRLLKQC